MYAVIRTGGKQYKVAPGDRIEVEKLSEAELSLTPLLVVDGEEVTVAGSALEGLPVVAKVVGEGRGKKINAGKYKAKSRYRRRWGHRQDFTLIEIESIGGKVAEKPEEPEAGEDEPVAEADGKPKGKAKPARGRGTKKAVGAPEADDLDAEATVDHGQVASELPEAEAEASPAPRKRAARKPKAAEEVEPEAAPAPKRAARKPKAEEPGASEAEAKPSRRSKAAKPDPEEA